MLNVDVVDEGDVLDLDPEKQSQLSAATSHIPLTRLIDSLVGRPLAEQLDDTLVGDLVDVGGKSSHVGIC